MTYLFNTFIFHPFYNGLILLIDFLPFFDAGVVIIIFTIIVKIILLPLSIKASKSQIELKGAEKDLKVIKEKYKNNQEELARQTVDYYRQKKINPFAGILVLIIQLPIVIGLYQVFLKSGLPSINTDILYNFISIPESVNMIFLNLVNISQKSLILAIIAGVTTYLQFSLASKNTQQSSEGEMQGDIVKAMTVQMKYIFPILVIFISYNISGALSIYWITSNIFSIFQEIYIKKKYHQTPVVV